jgi:hypothetical protein
MRRLTSHPLRAGAAALAVGVIACGGSAAANDWGLHHPKPPPPTSEEEPLAASVWRSLDPTARAAALDPLPDEDAEKLGRFLDQVVAGEPVPVSAAGKVIGKVDTDELDGSKMPKSKDDLAPIVDDVGRTVAYWGGPLGLLDPVTAIKASINPAAVAAKRGLNPDGTVRQDLLEQVPIPPVVVLPSVTDTTVPPSTKPPKTVLPPPLSLRPPHPKPPSTR